MTEKRSRRRALKLLGTGSLVAVAGCVTDELDGADDDPGAAEDPTPTPEGDGSADGGSTPTPEEDETPTPDDESLADPATDLVTLRSDDDLFDPSGTETFEGTGSASTDEFELDDGFVAFEFEYAEEGNFMVDLVDAESGERDPLITMVGPVDGTMGIGISAGTYSLSVSASADWSLAVGQPGVPEEHLRSPPVLIENESHETIGPIEVDGRVTFSASHDAEGHFVAMFHEVDETRRNGTILFNQVGGPPAVFEGETDATLSGVGWVDVAATGNYEIEIR